MCSVLLFRVCFVVPWLHGGCSLGCFVAAPWLSRGLPRVMINMMMTMLISTVRLLLILRASRRAAPRAQRQPRASDNGPRGSARTCLPAELRDRNHDDNYSSYSQCSSTYSYSSHPFLKPVSSSSFTYFIFLPLYNNIMYS